MRCASLPLQLESPGLAPGLLSLGVKLGGEMIQRLDRWSFGKAEKCDALLEASADFFLDCQTTSWYLARKKTLLNFPSLVKLKTDAFS
jgi:hypothetical protein